MLENAQELIAPSLEAIGHAPWGDWRGFWLTSVFDDRFTVCYFLLLLPMLLSIPHSRLRHGIIFSGLLFLTYVFGPAYALFWLLAGIGLHQLGEWLASGDRGRWPVVLASAIVAGSYVALQLGALIRLPHESNEWLFGNASWLFPLGTRSFGFEPFWAPMEAGSTERKAPPLLAALFWNPHNIGTAYLVVRMLHYYSELRRRTIPVARRRLTDFLAYVCYAPALLQGPIERYSDFQNELDVCHVRRSWRNLLPAAARIGWGITKSLIVTLFFLPLLRDELGIGTPENTYYWKPSQIRSTLLLYLGVFIQIFALYLEFSGYCDVSAGIARLLGYRQIENFSRPWFATSMRDFWRRWHISLSSILRDYVYIPLGGNRRHPRLNLYVTFVLCGLWHIPTLNMALWGLVMGLMLAVNQAWAQWMKRLDESPQGILPAVRRAVIRLRPLPTIVSWFFTMNCFVLSLLIFFDPLMGRRVTTELLRRFAAWVAGG